MTADNLPVWWHRLAIVRERHPEMSDRVLATRCGLSHTTVTYIFSGVQLHPKRETLAKLIFTLTERPGERESVLSAFDTLNDTAEQDAFDNEHPGARERHAARFDPRSDTQILAEAVDKLAQAIDKLAEAIIREV